MQEAIIILGGLLHELDETDCPQTFTEEMRDGLREQVSDAVTTLEASNRPRNRVGHEACPVCSANVHGRVTVALNYLAAGKISRAKDELKALLPLVQP